MLWSLFSSLIGVSPSSTGFYEGKGYFPNGTARALVEEAIPKPRDGETVVFRDFFTTGLRFPCDCLLLDNLYQFQVKLPQLTLNAFVRLSNSPGKL